MVGTPRLQDISGSDPDFLKVLPVIDAKVPEAVTLPFRVVPATAHSVTKRWRHNGDMVAQVAEPDASRYMIVLIDSIKDGKHREFTKLRHAVLLPDGMGQ